MPGNNAGGPSSLGNGTAAQMVASQIANQMRGSQKFDKAKTEKEFGSLLKGKGKKGGKDEGVGGSATPFGVNFKTLG